jgi:polysaccharide biosynthesis protein PelA
MAMTFLPFRRRDLLAISFMVFGLSAGALPDPGPQVWGIDYSAETDPALARRYNLLILEPGFDRPLAPLRGKGTKILGYISLSEVHMDRPFAPALAKAGALSDPNPNWRDVRYADLRHPAWRAMVLDELVPAILLKGYDGIFMDTLDNAEALESKKPGMLASAADLIQQIRSRFPGMTTMMNTARSTRN